MKSNNSNDLINIEIAQQLKTPKHYQGFLTYESEVFHQSSVI